MDEGFEETEACVHIEEVVEMGFNEVDEKE